MTLTVPELEGQEVEKPTTVANDESKRWRGGKGSTEKMEERANWIYCEILKGGTRKQITVAASLRFGCSQRTADSDYTRALELLKLEQSATRSDLLNQIQGLRLAVIRRAMAKGQYATCQMLLKDLGAVIGETVEAEMEATPSLNITIQRKGASEE